MGKYGPHGGIHIALDSTEDTPLFACADGLLIQSIHYQKSTAPDEYINACLVFEHTLPWPGSDTPQRFYSLWASPKLESLASKFKAGECIASACEMVHWEIFWQEQSEPPFENPLRNWLEIPSWNEEPFLSHSHLCEWDGPQAWMQGASTETTQHYHAAATRQHWWNLGFSSVQAKYAHPWHALLLLAKREPKLPHFANGTSLTHSHWDEFRLLVALVEKAIASQRTNTEPLVCQALAHAFLARKLCSDWSHCQDLAALGQLHYGEETSPLEWAQIPSEQHLSAAQLCAILSAYLNPIEHKRPLFHKASETLAQQDWNSYALEPPLCKGGFLFYGFKSPTSCSAIHPSLFIQTKATFVEPGQNFEATILCRGIPHAAEKLTQMQWSFFLDEALQHRLNGETMQGKIPCDCKARKLILIFKASHQGAPLSIRRELEIRYGACLKLQLNSLQLSFASFLAAPRTFALQTSLQSSLTNLQGFYDLRPPSLTANSLEFFDSHQKVAVSISSTEPIDVQGSVFAAKGHTHYWLSNHSEWPRLLQLIDREQISRIDLQSSSSTIPFIVPISCTSLRSDAECRAKLAQLGYWCDQYHQGSSRALQHAWHTFQVEFGIVATGESDAVSKQALSQATQRPGLPVHATVTHKGRAKANLHSRFFQLNAPRHAEYFRYGDTIATPVESSNVCLRGILHNDIWGVHTMVDALQNLLLEWHAHSGDPMQVGDLSLWCGGQFREHQSHQKGTSADCRSYVVGAPKINGSRNSKYNVDATEEFCRMAHRWGFGIIYTSCPQLLSRLGKGSRTPIVTDMEGHEHHLHLEFTP